MPSREDPAVKSARKRRSVFDLAQELGNVSKACKQGGRARTSFWQRAVDCVAAIPQDERLFGPTDVTKAVLHTWLARQETLGHPVGKAIKVDRLKHHAEPAQSLSRGSIPSLASVSP